MVFVTSTVLQVYKGQVFLLSTENSELKTTMIYFFGTGAPLDRPPVVVC